MPKLISFLVPCYNSSAYMEKCITNLIDAGDEVEVIIVDDGSEDNTLKIAKNLENKYPTIVKAIHQENKGHGGAIQTGINNAKGLYFKVIDSDDWALTSDVTKFLNLIKTHLEANLDVDLYISNYVYERVSENSSISVNYKNLLPENKVFSWENMKKFPQNKVFMMHSLMFKLSLLKECGLSLPEHTFYEDNYFCYQPLPHVKNVYYFNLDFYHYLLGRCDQSCANKNLYKNYKMQMKVTKCVFDSYSFEKIKNECKSLRKYMFHIVDAMYLLTLIFNSGSKSNLKERKKDIKFFNISLKKENPKLYKRARRYFPNILLSVRPFFIRRLIAKFALFIRYKLSL